MFYQVEGTLLRSIGNEANPIEISEIFKAENPKAARDHAFKYFQNYIDVFLESVNVEFESVEQAQAELVDFYNSHKEVYFRNNHDLKIENDIFNGLGIYFILGDSKTFTTLEGKLVYEERKLIHFFGTDYEDQKVLMQENLITEAALYQEFDLQS